MDIEIHVPMSPTEGFFNRFRYLFRSWQINGDRHLSYRFVITIGSDEPPYDFSQRVPWAKDQPISWRWFDRELFCRHSWWGTINDRFRADIKADYLILMDADTLFAGTIADALKLMPSGGGVAGVTAYQTPFRELKEGETPEGQWQKLFAQAGLGVPQFSFRHSATGEMCPAYYNNAFFVVSRNAATQIGKIIFDEMDRSDRILGHMSFRDQVAMTTAIYRLGLATAILPLRFNHFIGRSTLPEFGSEWQEARVIHYTATELFNAEADGVSVDSVAQWLSRNQATKLEGIRTKFREALKATHDGIAPAAAALADLA